MKLNYDDNYDDFTIVIESATEPQKPEIIHEEKGSNGDLSFLRFKARLQSFTKRNRNRRLWLAKFTRPMFEAKEVKELLAAGGVPGESGHPVPDTGQPTIERILTIDPLRVSHVIREYQWPTDTLVDGIVETADEGPGTPGYRFMRNIMQGFPVSFSTRSIIPQVKNPDGTIDQTGIGRYVTSDRVYLPGHDDAYIDKSFPVKNICKKSTFETMMESFVSFTVEKSDRVNRIVDGMDPVMEQASIDRNGVFTIPIRGIGSVIVAPENKYRKEFADFMGTL